MANFQNKTEISEEKKQPERKLWEAVLFQVFKDAFENTYSREKGEKRHALNYLKTMHEDYYTVCEYAGLDANYVHKKVKRKINLDLLKSSGMVWNFTKKKGKK